jgi:hypothetical protein
LRGDRPQIIFFHFSKGNANFAENSFFAHISTTNKLRMETCEYKELSQEQLVLMFKDIQRLQSEESHFCFLLGAGTSSSSGIPTGWELSKRWYEEIKAENLGENESWMKEITDENVGEYYTQLYKKRYESNPDLGYEEFERLMDGKKPGIGYAILAQILTQTPHHFVLTTNFDYMVEDAVQMYTSQKPFIAAHETLAEFISLQTQRPTIIEGTSRFVPASV